MTLSPASKVDPWDRADGIAKLTQQLDVVRDIIGNEALFSRRDPNISGWSVGEHAGHLAIVCGRMGLAVEKNLTDPARASDEASADFLEPILTTGDFPRGVAQAPPGTEAVGRTREELQAVLDETDDRWRKLSVRADDVDSCPSRTRHHRFGFLTARQWLRLATVHNAHHLTIVNEIRESPSP